MLKKTQVEEKGKRGDESGVLLRQQGDIVGVCVCVLAHICNLVAWHAARLHTVRLPLRCQCIPFAAFAYQEREVEAWALTDSMLL